MIILSSFILLSQLLAISAHSTFLEHVYTGDDVLFDDDTLQDNQLFQQNDDIINVFVEPFQRLAENRFRDVKELPLMAALANQPAELQDYVITTFVDNGDLIEFDKDQVIELIRIFVADKVRKINNCPQPPVKPPKPPVKPPKPPVKPPKPPVKPPKPPVKPPKPPVKPPKPPVKPPKPPGPGPSGGLAITFNQFANALKSSGYPAPTQAQYNAFTSQAKSKAGINNLREAAMLLAHCIWETGGLKFKEEIACKVTKCPGVYGTSKYAGKSYYGRGYLQLSWNYNYEAASKYLYGDDRLLRDPDMVARDENISWATALWFWKVNVNPDPRVKQGHFGASTRKINGGLECDGAHKDKAKKRFEIYKKVLVAFNVKDKPVESGCYN